MFFTVFQKGEDKILQGCLFKIYKKLKELKISLLTTQRKEYWD